MFTLTNGREHLWQWDSNQRILVEDPTITQVHFCNKTTPNSLVVETYTDDTYDGKVYAEIPNILLQESWDICVYAFCNCYTKVEERIKVKARSKPEDYVYTETEVLNYQTLLDKMNGIEENIGQSVADYLTEHPIESGATQEEVAQINKNTEDIENLNTEIDNLPTKQYVDDAVKNVEVDLDGYATEQWVNNQGYLKTVPSEYVTESELEAKGYLTEHQDISGKSDVGHTHSYNDLTDKPTIPSLEGYATEQYVDDAIAGIEIPEGGDVDLSDYYTKEETDTAIDTAVSEIDLSEYQTIKAANNQHIYLRNAFTCFMNLLALKSGQEIGLSYTPLIIDSGNTTAFADSLKTGGFCQWKGTDSTYFSENILSGSITGVWTVDNSGNITRISEGSSFRLSTNYVYILWSAYIFGFESIDTLLSAISSNLVYDNTTSHLTATTIQTAIDELASRPSGGDADLSNYYTKQQIDNMFNNIATAEGGSY